MSDQGASLEEDWKTVMAEAEMLDRSAVEAEYAVRQAIAALRGFRCIKKGSNIPTDIYYPTLVELMVEMEKVVAL